MPHLLKMLTLWVRRIRYREGRVISFWPLIDHCQQIQICDTARLAEGIVGIRSRTFSGMDSSAPLPEFGDVRYVSVAELGRRETG